MKIINTIIQRTSSDGKPPRLTVQFATDMDAGDIAFFADLVSKLDHHPAFVVSALAARCRMTEALEEADGVREEL